MCGIAGIVYKNKTKDFSAIVSEMLALVRHRGPDGHGLFETANAIFGHTRLAIIDLGHGGHQPMCYMDRFVITFNGEIYNYVELRKELSEKGYFFTSKSDTEVVLAAYAEWGEDCTLHLNGMFAFAIYDLANKSLFLARDRVGEKPLYYFQSENELYFFSEPKQVIVPQIIKPCPNETAIHEYLQYQFCLTGQTFFKGIYKLLPGHSAIFKNGLFAIKKYWSLSDIEVDTSISYDVAKEDIRRLVTESLKIRLRSDVKVASYLSGGIDSTVVAALASQNLSDLSTFTFTSKKYPRYDESEKAAKTAKGINSDHHEIEMEFSDTLALWKKSIYFMDEPAVGYSLLSQMVVSQEVARHTKVVLGGQGGDELFFGYGWYNHTLLKALFTPVPDVSWVAKIQIAGKFLQSLSLKHAAKIIFESLHWFRRPLYEIYFQMWRSYGCHGLLREDNCSTETALQMKEYSCLTSLKKFEFSFWLQGLLHVEDRSSMANGLESRVPLLDHRLIEYVFTLPPKYMIDGLLNKKIFVDAFQDVLPRHVTNVKQKMGYVSPAHAWFTEPTVSKYVKRVIENKDSFIYNFVDFTKVTAKKLSERQTWMLISLEIWYELYISKQGDGCAP